MKPTSNDIARMIREKWPVVTYCRDILGLPVYHDGDRSISPLPNRQTERSDAFIVHSDWWYDFSQNTGGDVIELCALVKHNGDRGEAFRELGQEFYAGIKPASWRRHTESLSAIIDRWHKALRPEDRDYLHARRITDETIDRLKLGYCPDKRSWYFDRIIIPYWQGGRPVYYAGRDCSGLWKTDSKNHPKYKKMWTDQNEYSENTMWGCHTHGRDWCDDPEKDKYLCILEGQFDAMSFEQEHWHVLSPIGGHFAGKLMPMVRSICRRFERVFICMDNDGPGVAFQQKIARFCFANNIPFVCGHVQHIYGNASIKDVSDYYTAGGDLMSLVQNAEDGIKSLAQSFSAGQEQDYLKFMTTAGRYVDSATLTMFSKIVEKRDVFDALFVKECLKVAKKPPIESEITAEVLKAHNILYMVNDGYYEYEHGVWNEKPGVAVQNYAAQVLGNYAVSGRMISVMRHVSAKRWNAGQFNTQNIINFNNGVLELDTMKFMGHNPGYMSSIQIPRCYDSDARCNRWLEVLDEVTDGDKVKQRLLRQMAGYFFWADNRLETGFILQGEGGNGKSVIIETLRYVMDPRNCSEVDLSKMGDNFAPMALRNSLVNFCTETSIDLKASEVAIKKVISGDTIMAAHKGIDAVAFVPRCKLVCACNNAIASKDTSWGFMRRLKFIEFNHTFSEGEADTGLRTELQSEAAGILNWMIEGCLDLRASGKFVKTEEDIRLRREFLEQANPIAAFIRMRLAGRVGSHASSDLFEEYKEWAKKMNVGAVSGVSFTKVLKRLLSQTMPEVKYSRTGGSHYIFPGETESPDSWGDVRVC